MHFIDSHAHLNSNELYDWEKAVIEAKNAGLSAIINIGSDLADSEKGVAQAKDEPIVYATVGIHPEHLSGQASDMEQQLNNLRRLIDQTPKVVGIGEIGLDYTLDPHLAPKQVQLELLQPQLELASQLHIPVVLHVRDQKGSTDCFNDLVTILKQFTTHSLDSSQLTSNRLTGVFHCWTGTPDQAETALELGFFISFSGIVTYKSAGHISDAATMVPDNRLLIETDAPYLVPEPARSDKRTAINEPKYVILTAEKLASLRQTTLQHIAEITATNAQRLFKIPQ